MHSKQDTWRLRALLMDLISPVRPVAQERLDALSEADWELLMRMTRQHRLGPLLHWQLSNARSALHLPQGVRQDLARMHQQATLRSLQVQRELVLTHRILEQAGMPHMALKGAYLAWHVYPHPALRPLRDLDILVPRADALRAYQIFLDGGFSRIDKYGYEGTPEIAMDLAQHLPPLRSASGRVSVELHTRVFHINEDHRDHPDLSDEPGFWKGATQAAVAHQAMLFEAPTHLLLHLIVHAIYDHEFTNGPLVLSDLAFLLRKQTIDWPLFWSLAERLGYVPGCCLTLQLVEHYWGALPLDWCGHGARQAPAAADLEEVAVFMLRDFDGRDEVIIQAALEEQGTRVGRIRYLLRKVFISKERMASLFPVRPDDWRIYLYYPVRWANVFWRKVWNVFGTTKDQHLALDVRLLARLRHRLKA